ncbi:iron-hydroxamate ABC transporter substrate-binding protein [Peribacillus muralis]|uniref:iron-hydroxamate ABC transporter substrate-binding protein n=1 Tax=Peribacillus muralis TaxID=264697 RepID=UPI003CFF0982
MKKLLLPIVFIFTLIVSACGNAATEKTTSEKNKKDTITYQSENGAVEVPANPKRVIVLASYAGDVLSLGVNLVGVEPWSKKNPRFEKKLKDVQSVSEDELEKIIELDPDLIIGASTTKNLDKLKEIAPTVTYTYGKVDYLSQHLEIGKLLNKEKKAQAWIDDYKSRSAAAGKQIKEKIGEDATVTVVESYDKQLAVFGDNWGRGTEVLYQEMGLKMPDKVKEMVHKEGYYSISLEVLPQYVGDYLVISKYRDQDNSFQNTEVYKQMPAVKNDHVFEANGNEFIFNDPLTLDYQLEFFKSHFLD